MMSFACAVLAFLPWAASPEAEGVSSKQVMKWIDACEREIDVLHGFVLLRHGKLVAEGSWAPYDTLNETHRLSSHSKCFITTAAGFLVDEGKLDLDECVIDILPDKAPANPSRELVRLRVRDLLTMTLGAKAGNDETWRNDRDGDWVKAILASPLDGNPGQAFEYDSGATHILGVIIERRAGRPLFEFLRERLFRRIGIEKAWTTYDPMGQACAAWGFNMTTREISLIGQLYLDKGVWNGERLLSEEWTTLATTKQTHSGKSFKDRDPGNDWLHGFGFNFWRCQHGCYRADGSGGQYTIVFPEHEAVLSINSDVWDMQQVLNVVWEHFLPALAKDALPEDRAGAAALKARCKALAHKPVAGKREGADEFCGTYFPFKKSTNWLKGVRVDRKDGAWEVRLTTDAGEQAVPAAYGSWARSTVHYTKRTSEPLGELIGPQRVAASAAVQDDGSLKVTIHQLDGMRRIELRFCRKLFRKAVEGAVTGHTKLSTGLF